MAHDVWHYYSLPCGAQGTALSVPCPYCKAPAGERCHLKFGVKTKKPRGVHRQRKVAFKLYNKAVRALEGF